MRLDYQEHWFFKYQSAHFRQGEYIYNGDKIFSEWFDLPTLDFFHRSFFFLFSNSLICFFYLFASFFGIEQMSELTTPFLYIINMSKLSQPFSLH